MNSKERHEARYQRRKAKRQVARRSRLAPYDDFERVAKTSALITAHFESRRGVMWKASVARYDMHFYRNAELSHRALMKGTSVHDGFYTFDIVERGKLRHIHSLHYAERVIRRSLCTNALVPILSSNLIYDNGASIKGKGISFAINRMATQLHQYYRRTGSNDGWILLVDFSKYFDNIRHDELYRMLDKMIFDPRLNAIAKANIKTCDYDKPDAEKGKGLFIGPEDSQIYAVAYPNNIDHKIKDQWRVKEFNRYMDDSGLIQRYKEDLIRMRDDLFVEYAKKGIIPNPKKTQIVKLSHGFVFLKTWFLLTKTGRVVMKPVRGSIVRERRKLKKFKRFYDAGEMTLAQVEQSYMSWRGYIRQKDSYHSVHSMDALFYNLFRTTPWKNKKKRRKKQ